MAIDIKNPSEQFSPRPELQVINKLMYLGIFILKYMSREDDF